ncbi:hypothetical protein EDD22DRAFT_747413, partial [Suillus occidentalis]
KILHRILLSGTLYPGDDPNNADLLACDHFFLYCMTEHEYVIMDSRCWLDPEITVPLALSANPCFELDRWYWCHLGLQWGF